MTLAGRLTFPVYLDQLQQFRETKRLRLRGVDLLHVGEKRRRRIQAAPLCAYDKQQPGGPLSHSGLDRRILMQGLAVAILRSIKAAWIKGNRNVSQKGRRDACAPSINSYRDRVVFNSLPDRKNPGWCSKSRWSAQCGSPRFSNNWAGTDPAALASKPLLLVNGAE